VDAVRCQISTNYCVNGYKMTIQKR